LLELPVGSGELFTGHIDVIERKQYIFDEASLGKTFEVVDVPGKPGVYKAIAFLRPHFQLDELTVSLRLTSKLPSAKAG
jgi:predicted component of type VI protein secretion system